MHLQGQSDCCLPNGWTDADLFLEYLKHFVSYTKCSKNAPVLLILDRLDDPLLIFFKLLKSAFNAACSTCCKINVDQFGELFNAAYLKAVIMEKAVSGF